jgi:hypothetical protein
MGLTTPRYALRYPVAADANNVPSDMLNLATDLDNKMSTFTSGLLSARPAAGTSGRFYYATDTKDVSYDTGSAWRSLTGAPIIPVARYYVSAGGAAAGSTLTAVAWNATSFNRNGMPTAATKLVVPATGYWRIRAQVRFNIGGTSGGQAVCAIYKGPNSDTAGTQIAYKQETTNWTGVFDNDLTVGVETCLQLNSGDDVAVKQAATPASTIYGSAAETFLEAELVSVS